MGDKEKQRTKSIRVNLGLNSSRLRMTTECLVPLRIQPHFVQHTSGFVDWNARATIERTETLASAPSFSSFDTSVSSEDQENPSFCVCGIPEQVRHCLADFLSSGNADALHVNNENVGHYLNIANKLHHVQLINICQKFLNVVDNNGNSVRDNNGNIKAGVSQHQACLSNKNSPHCPNAPVFHIMFLRAACVNHSNQVLLMDVRKNEIQKIDVKKITRFGDGFASCAVYKKGCPYVLVSGGSGKTSQTLQKYDVVENKWMVCDSMKNPRSKHCMAFWEGNVYIIGGKRCWSIEKYSIETNICSEVARLSVCIHSAAVAAYGDKIYIFGGKTLKGNVRCVQCLDVRTNKLFRLQDLPTECSGGHAVVVNDVIYFATNNGHMIKFYPDSGQSELCSQQPYKRKHFAMFLRNNQLIIFGGIKSEGPSRNGETNNQSTVYAYCPEQDSWKLLSADTGYGDLSVHTSCTVRYPKECPVKPFMKLYGYC